MYKKLILYRNELKNKRFPACKMIGIVSELLLSRQIFPENREIKEFLKEIFSFQLQKHLYESRTLIVAGVIKEITAMESDASYKAKLYQFAQAESG